MQDKTVQDDVIDQNRQKWERLRKASLKACKKNIKAGEQLFYDEEKLLYNDEKITPKMLSDRNKSGWHSCVMTNFLFHVHTLNGKKYQNITTTFANGVKNAFSQQAEYCKNNNHSFFKKIIFKTPDQSECKEMLGMIDEVNEFLKELKHQPTS